MDLNIQTILGGLILAGILWIAKSVSDQGKALSVLQTLITGANGENGLNGEVKTLRDRTHTHGDQIHSLFGVRDLHEQRIGVLEEERRVGPAERRLT